MKNNVLYQEEKILRGLISSAYKSKLSFNRVILSCAVLWCFLFFLNVPEVKALQLPVSQDMAIPEGKTLKKAGSKAKMKLGSKVAGKKNFIVYLKFDDSALPTGLDSNNITKVTLRVYVNKTQPAGPITVLPIAAAWTEQDIVAPPLLDGMTVSSEISGRKRYVSIDVTEVFKAWVSGEIANEGLAIKANGAFAFLDSKENKATGHEPTLEVALENSGPQGLQGDEGVQGLVGPIGPIGPQGIQGDPGLQGPIGMTGAAGPQGQQGIQGVPGPIGPQGATGAAGPAGLQGVQGIPGPVGPQGPVGIVGTNSVTVTNFATLPSVRVNIAAGGQAIDANLLTIPIFAGPEDFDTFNSHSVIAAENPERLNTGYPGYYQVTLEIDWAANATGVREIQILKNGVTLMARQVDQAASSGSHSQIATTLVQLSNVTDWVEARVFQTTSVGGPLNIRGQFMMHWVGPL